MLTPERRPSPLLPLAFFSHATTVEFHLLPFFFFVELGMGVGYERKFTMGQKRRGPLFSTLTPPPRWAIDFLGPVFFLLPRVRRPRLPQRVKQFLPSQSLLLYSLDS